MRKIIALLLSLVLVGVAGCGAPNAESGSQTSTSSSTSGTSTTESDPATDPIAAITDDGTPKTITYWHTFTEGARKDYIDQMVKDYMALHPNVTINVEVYPWNVFTQKWTAGLAAGTLPDISSVNPDNLFAINQAGACLPMDPLVKELGDDYFLKKPLENFTVDGKVMALPYYLHSYVLWYRNDILEKAGVEVPTNWDELLEVTKKIANPLETYGFTIAMSKNDQMSAQLLACFAKAAGVPLITEDNKGNLTDPQVMKALQLMADLYKVGSPEGSVNFGLSEQNDIFFQGKSAFAFGSGFHINGVKQNAPDLLDSISAVPFFGPDGQNADNCAWVIGLMGWNQTKYPETVYDFMKFHYEKQQYIDFLHLIPGGQMPATTEAAIAPEFLNDPTIQKFSDEIAIIQKGIENGTFLGMDFGLTPAAAALTSQGIIEECLQDMVLNNTPVEQAAQKANDKLNAAIDILMS